MSEFSRADENEQYRQLRNELKQAETRLKEEIEKVAVLRRQLPLGRMLTLDYLLTEGPQDLSINSADKFFRTPFSKLFVDKKNYLIVVHLMFGEDWKEACPMCSMWMDSYDAVAPHLQQSVNFVVIAKAPLEKLREFAKKRAWHQARLLSSYNTSFNRDFGVEDEQGGQYPAVSVFVKNDEGKIHHFYTTENSLSHTHHRGIDLYTPVWNLFDLLPTGRPDWMPTNDFSM